MTYRTAPQNRVFEFRPQPGTATALVVPSSVLFVGIGVFLLGGTLQAWVRGAGFGAALVLVFAMGIAFLLMGSGFLWLSVRGARTMVRLVLAQDDLVIEWRRGGNVVKTERVPVSDLVDVALDREASSGGSGYIHRLVLGTRSADIRFDDMLSSSTRAYRKQQKAICAFLSLPARAEPG